MNQVTRPDLWDYLARQEKPVVLWGMGDGADKILRVMEARKIPVDGFFASDGFVRGQSFHGMTVRSYGDMRAAYGDGGFITLLAFGSALPDVLANIERVASENELYVPDVPAFGDTLFDAAFYHDNAGKFAGARALLSDDLSRDVFDRVIEYKLSGALAPLLSSRTSPDEPFRSILHPDTYRCTIDLGAYTGDTVRELAAASPRLCEVLAFEPDERTFKKLDAYAAGTTVPHVQALHLAAWDRDETLTFGANGGRGASLSRAGRVREVRGDSVDRQAGLLLKDRKIDYIKFDVEGAEREAILGAAGIIRRDKPELLVSLYHRSEDLFALPLLLADLCPGRRFYLRRPGGIPAWDLNLYVI